MGLMERIEQLIYIIFTALWIERLVHYSQRLEYWASQQYWITRPVMYGFIESWYLFSLLMIMVFLLLLLDSFKR